MVKKATWIWIRTIVGICLILSLLSLAACKSNEKNTETSSFTETEATETASTAEDIEIPEPDNIVEIFNTQMELMLLSNEESEGELVLGTLLPYLTSDSELSEMDSFIINSFTTTGNASTLPDEVIYHNGVLTSTGTDPEKGAYRTIEVTGANGSASFYTLGGETSVTALNVTPQFDSIFGTKEYEFPTLNVEDLTETEIQGVMNLSNTFTRSLLKAVTGDFKMGKMYSVPGELDVRKLSSDGVLRLTLSGLTDTGDVAATLEISFYNTGKQEERVELILGDGESEVMSYRKKMADGVIRETEVHMNENGVDTLLRQNIEGERIDLLFECNTENILSMSLEMSIELRDESTYTGTFHMDMQVLAESGNDLSVIPISTDSNDATAKSDGEFTAILKDGMPDSMEISMLTTAGSVSTDTQMLIRGASAKVGDIIMQTISTVKNSADPSANSFSKIEIKLLSGNTDSGTFAITATNTAGDNSSTVTANMTAPADRTPEYTTLEAKLITRAMLMLSDPESIKEATQAVVDALSKTLSQPSFFTPTYPDLFYTPIANGKGIAAFIRLVREGNMVHIYADTILDPENYSYFYYGYNTSGTISSTAGIEQDQDRLKRAIDTTAYNRTEYTSDGRSKALAYFYNSRYDIYVLYNAPQDSPAFVTEEPTQEDFPGYALHKITFDENGNVVGNVHNYVTTYDENCIETLTCKECEYKMTSRKPIHTYTKNLTVVCEQNEKQPHTTYASCERCDFAMISLTDANSNTLEVLLKPAAQEAIAMANSGSRDYASWKHIGTDRDLTNCKIITEITIQYDYSKTFGCDIIIPDLREKVGVTILGITFSDSTYFGKKIQDFKIVFPEGMEYIGNTGQRLFQSVTELVLPETLRYLDYNALYDYQGEDLVLPASLEAWYSSGIHIQNLKSLTIKGEYYQASPKLLCPNLEELTFHGTFDIFIGFGTECKIVELVIPEGVKVIGSGACDRMRSLQRVVLPDSLVDIGSYAFRFCTNLNEISIPASVTLIGEQAFMDCDSLKDVELLGVTDIARGAFSSCEKLEEVVVSERLTSVGPDAFRYCAALHTINLPETATIGTDAFKGCVLLEQ